MRELRFSRLLAISFCSSIGFAAACSGGGDGNGPGGAGQQSVLGGSGGSPTGGMAGTTGNAAGTQGNTAGTTAPGAGSGGATGMAGMGTAGTPAGGSGGAGGTGSPPVGDPNSWRMMGYDSTNTYHNPEEKSFTVENAATLVEKWRFTVSGFPPGTPVIAEGKVFVMATGGSYAIDLATGAMVWARMDLTGSASVAYDNGFVYLHTGFDANLWKVNASDGMTVWGPVKTYDLQDCDGMSSPIVGGGKVIVGHSCGVREVGPTAAGSYGGVEAFDLETGMRAWTYWTAQKDGAEDGAMVWSTVGIDVPGATVYASTGNNYTTAGANSDSIHAIDLATGMGKWKKQVRPNDVWSLFVVPLGQDTDFGANPIIATVNGAQVVAAGDKGSAFWSLDRATGNINWDRQDLSASHNQANGGILMNGAFDGQYFYAVSNGPVANNCVMHKMDGSTGVSMWMKTYPKVTWGAPSSANGLLFVPINDDLYVLNAADGETLKMFNTGGTIAAGAPAVAQGRIVVGSGMQYMFAANGVNNNQVIAYGLP